MMDVLLVKQEMGDAADFRHLFEKRGNHRRIRKRGMLQVLGKKADLQHPV